MTFATIRAAAAAFGLLLALAAPPAARADAITGLFNTGVDGTGTVLAGGVDDPHYTIVSAPTPAGMSDVVLNPINGSWSANDAVSQWIGPDQYGSTGNNGDPGNYIYRTTFTLAANVDLGSVVLTGLWATDNNGTDILINGLSTGQVSPVYYALGAFAVTSGFVTGLNTLDFLVTNLSGVVNPTGLRVTELAGTFETAVGIPAPAALPLMALGVAGLAAVRRRRATA